MGATEDEKAADTLETTPLIDSTAPLSVRPHLPPECFFRHTTYLLHPVRTSTWMLARTEARSELCFGLASRTCHLELRSRSSNLYHPSPPTISLKTSISNVTAIDTDLCASTPSTIRLRRTFSVLNVLLRCSSSFSLEFGAGLGWQSSGPRWPSIRYGWNLKSLLFALCSASPPRSYRNDRA